MCGEKVFFLIKHSITSGSPPHVRGKVGKAQQIQHRVVDHPRMCGEKTKKIP